MYSNLQGSIDYEKAFKYYSMAADKENKEAQLFLGFNLLNTVAIFLHIFNRADVLEWARM